MVAIVHNLEQIDRDITVILYTGYKKSVRMLCVMGTSRIGWTTERQTK